MDKNVNIGSSLAKFTFSDNDGNVVAYFRMNPADINLAERAKEVARYFKENVPQAKTGSEALAQCDKALSDKMDFLLGYKASETLFGFMSPTTILSDGRFFFTLIMETISTNIGEEIRKRYEKFASVRKYTDKYE